MNDHPPPRRPPLRFTPTRVRRMPVFPCATCGEAVDTAGADLSRRVTGRILCGDHYTDYIMDPSRYFAFANEKFHE